MYILNTLYAYCLHYIHGIHEIHVYTYIHYVYIYIHSTYSTLRSVNINQLTTTWGRPHCMIASKLRCKNGTLVEMSDLKW